MNSQLFFLLNLVAGLAFVVWFLSSRRGGGSRPTRLNLKERDGDAPLSETPPPAEKPAAPPSRDAGLEEREARVRRAKNLNVLFLYNGHDWDAYAVLGLPAGASLPLVTERYQQLIRHADKGELEFYEAAYQAILKKL
ncbi:MAG: hypothetical protein KF802_04440 [Bdellovibrionaceae bacterium]|nr:hypothetical protein [Pseudobdellovibrionaceae bacterium]MBX3034201.1 hypothetical protein [Pseudobdellovibrionaceae bacterium]